MNEARIIPIMMKYLAGKPAKNTIAIVTPTMTTNEPKSGWNIINTKPAAISPPGNIIFFTLCNTSALRVNRLDKYKTTASLNNSVGWILTGPA